MNLKFLLTLLLLPLLVISSNLVQVAAQPAAASSFVAKPSTNYIGEESFYAFHIKLLGPSALQFVDTIKIQFPSPSFDIKDARLVQATGVVIDNVSKIQNSLENSLVLKLRKPNPVSDATVLVDGIINPTSEDNKLTLTATSGGEVKFGPLDSSVKLKKMIIGGESIVDNSITGKKIADNSITGSDISTDFMVRKTLKDDSEGHDKGWWPTGFRSEFTIEDRDIGPPFARTFITVLPMYLDRQHGECHTDGMGLFRHVPGAPIDIPMFHIKCGFFPLPDTELIYEIHKTP